MKVRFQVGSIFLATILLISCVVFLRQPEPLPEPLPDHFVMRVSKDGTVIMLRHDYAKVKAAMEVMVPQNLKRLGSRPEAATESYFRVNESIAGEACQVRLDEKAITTLYWHSTVIEARRIVDGLTQVRIRSEQGGFSSLTLLTGKPKRTRTPEVERRRLAELNQVMGP